MIQLTTKNPRETQKLAALLSSHLQNIALGNICIALNGTLGVGKTCFSQGFADGLQVLDEVLSPTFAIVHEYSGAVDLLHMDFYRLEKEDLPNLALDEVIQDHQGIVLIEWAHKHPELIESGFLRVDMDFDRDDNRLVSLQVEGENPLLEQALREFSQQWEREK